MKKIIAKAHDFDASSSALAATESTMPIADKILMVDPRHFDIQYSINPHMKDAYGNLNQINKEIARAQWLELKKTYEALNFAVFTIDGAAQLPDMVFCANQSFPYLDAEGNRCLALSNMYSDVRQKEVVHIANFFKKRQNYNIVKLAPRDEKHFFESTGDALWLPGVRFILGGYGFRTNPEIYSLLAEKTQSPIAIFKLVHPRFYHLDTCLSIINKTTALYCRDAFDADGIELLHKIFPNLIEVPLNEADSPGFACNAHCPDQKHVILQKGSVRTNEMLVQKGFIPIQINTNEFIKAGGSVFCMKLMFF